MIVTTTPTIEGRTIAEYFGPVAGECVLGANVFRDFFASIRDIVGGRAGGYQNVLRDGRHGDGDGRHDGGGARARRQCRDRRRY